MAQPTAPAKSAIEWVHTYEERYILEKALIDKICTKARNAGLEIEASELEINVCSQRYSFAATLRLMTPANKVQRRQMLLQTAEVNYTVRSKAEISFGLVTCANV